MIYIVKDIKSMVLYTVCIQEWVLVEQVLHSLIADSLPKLINSKSFFTVNKHSQALMIQNYQLPKVKEIIQKSWVQGDFSSIGV